MTYRPTIAREHADIVDTFTRKLGNQTVGLALYRERWHVVAHRPDGLLERLSYGSYQTRDEALATLNIQEVPGA